MQPVPNNDKVFPIQTSSASRTAPSPTITLVNPNNEDVKRVIVISDSPAYVLQPKDGVI